ncbi:MAG: protein translocase subunit SecD [Spirochaetales bacterium]|nr:protein translocase subunit SecD [Spirochaetales bacterium]
MSKRTRFLLVLVVVAVCIGFLYPTFDWYFLKPSWQIQLSDSSKNQIAVYSKGKTGYIVSAVTELLKEKPDSPLIEGLRAKIDSGIFLEKNPFGFLEDIARQRYKRNKEKYPKVLTVAAFMKLFPGSETRSISDLTYTIETHYADQANVLKDKRRRGGILQLGLDLSGGMNVVLQADFTALEDRLDEGESLSATEKSEAMDRAMAILSTRIDRYGLTEPSIRRLESDKIEIEIPGTSDPEIVGTFLKGKGSLEFAIVDQDKSQEINEYFTRNPGEIYDVNGMVRKPADFPAGLEILPFMEKNSYGDSVFRRWFVVYTDDKKRLDGIHIKSAYPGNHPRTGETIINFTLDTSGGEKFSQITRENKETDDGKQGTMAIILDDEIRSVAGIKDEIGSRGIITGFDRKEAADLALMLRTGAMPLKLDIDRQHVVGPSLGEDSIRRGLNALLIGFIAVIAFMLLYYKGAGFVADLALFLNIVFIVAILSAFNLTLTLTSIAGLILTVGMAVDANVIIFERIKEEYWLGKSAEASVKAGFQKAFWTIMDANITTLIAAVFLSSLGTGPIKGFAYTLAVGIVSSMFTALFVARLMFDFGLEALKMRKLSISWRKR